MTVSVTGCIPQAFLSLAPLDGPVGDHEDDGRPCLKRRAFPPIVLDTSSGGFFPFRVCLLFPPCHSSTASLPLDGRVQFLAFASSFTSVLESTPLIQPGSFLLTS